MSHYDTLGVGRDADAATIKRAYRKKASSAHPDRRDGNDEKMAAVNKAYAVLTDSTVRQRYDETGEDNAPPSFDYEVRDCVLSAIAAMVELDGNLVQMMKQGLTNKLAELHGEVAKRVQKRDYLRKRRGRARTPEGVVNLVHGVIDERIATAEKDIEKITHAVNVINAALPMVDQITWEDDVPVMPAFITYSAGTGGFR